jgi:cell division protease FtsH
LIDKEIRGIIESGYSHAEQLLRDNMSKLHAVAQALLEKEKLDEKDFEEIFAQA